MKQGFFTILGNTPIADKVYKLTLTGDTGAITAPGQFVNLLIPSLYLRRPISVCDWDDSTLTLIYKVVGEGTRALSEMAAGMKLDILTGLGNGFSALAKKLRESGLDVTVLLGFGKKTDVFYLEEFASIGVRVLCATMDGSVGTKGTVIDAIRAVNPAFDSLYACGPIPMLRALYDFTSCPALFSFEERMGCGFGACMGCTCHTVSGSKRICKDGPVLAREEIVWRT